MDNKKLYIIWGVTAALISVLLLIWIGGGQPDTRFDDYKGNGAPGATEQTTQATDEDTKGTEPDGTGSTDNTTDSNGTDNGGGNSSGGNGAAVEDTDIKIPIGNITGTTTTDSETTGNTQTESTESTGSTESTEATESTGSGGKIDSNEISFDDLVGREGN